MMANLQSLPHRLGRRCPAHPARPEIILGAHPNAQRQAVDESNEACSAGLQPRSLSEKDAIRHNAHD